MEGFNSKLVLSSLLMLLVLQATLVASSRLHLLQAPSGPNPGGNSHTQTSPRLLAGSGPNPGGNSKIDGSIKVHMPGVQVLNDAPSGPNPGGNAFLLGDAKLAENSPREDALALKNKLPKNTPTPNPGPSPIHNSVSKIVKVPKAKAAVEEATELLTKSPGPSPRGNSVSKVVKVPASRLVAERIDLRSKLPNNPTPNPGPSPVHNSVSRITIKSPEIKIGCAGAQETDPNLFAATSARIFSHN